MTSGEDRPYRGCRQQQQHQPAPSRRISHINTYGVSQQKGHSETHRCTRGGTVLRWLPGDYDLAQYLPDPDPLERSTPGKSSLVYTRTRHLTQLFELESFYLPRMGGDG